MSGSVKSRNSFQPLLFNDCQFCGYQQGNDPLEEHLGVSEALLQTLVSLMSQVIVHHLKNMFSLNMLNEIELLFCVAWNIALLTSSKVVFIFSLCFLCPTGQ